MALRCSRWHPDDAHGLVGRAPNLAAVPFRPTSDPDRFPVDLVTDEVLAALSDRGAAVVVAPPGAGKTTRLPLAVLDAFIGTGGILLTQPRRLAARMASERLAATIGERVGQTVGLRTGEETTVSGRTKLTVMTEGVLVRMLQSDATLDGVSAVLLDEVHERSLDIDLAMALLRDVRDSLRPDLRIALLSATLDDVALAAAFDAPVIRSEGRAFAVERRWTPVIVAEMANGCADAIVGAVNTMTGPGTVLVFAPGVGEIRGVMRALDRRRHGATAVLALHGGSPRVDTNSALAPLATEERRVVIATSVAQTSLTLPDVRVVIDQGLIRRSVVDTTSGLPRLRVERVSQATSTQRAGRAGRTSAGVAISLWSETEHRSLEEFDPPEIVRADITDVVLASLRWGARTVDSLSWVTTPSNAAWDDAVAILRSLDAVDGFGHLTSTGARLADVPVSAALARVVLGASSLGAEQRREAIALVALLATDRRGSDVSLAESIVELSDALLSPRRGGNETEQLARRIFALIPDSPEGERATSVAGLISLAMPSRLAVRSVTHSGRYTFADGLEAEIVGDDPVRGAEVIVAVEVDADRRRGRIFAALAVDPSEVETLHHHLVTEVTTTILDGDALSGSVVATSEQRLGAAILRRTRGTPTSVDITRAVLAGIDADTVERWMSASVMESVAPRCAFLARRDGGGWPDLSVDGLLASVDIWLAPLLIAAPARRPLGSVLPGDALTLLLDRDRRRELDRRAPMHVTLPTQREVAIDYTAEAGPTVRAKLQEFLGTRHSPTVDGVPCVVELLTPAGRPAAVTDDLARFWEVGYPQVRAELRGRYPRHDWPADPLNAAPQRGVKNPRRPIQ
jgi:ATP-dependent helicase HrpB